MSFINIGLCYARIQKLSLKTLITEDPQHLVPANTIFSKGTTETDKAYIAGFLDGDGSIIFQIIRNPSFKYGFQLRISIGFYQRIDKHWFIIRLHKMLKKSGNIIKRNDQITT